MDGIIFDLDGTLWNPSEDILRASNRLLEARGIKRRFVLRDVIRQIGRPMNLIFQDLYPELAHENFEHVGREFIRYEMELLRVYNEKRLYPGIMDVLNTLAMDYDLYIASNCQAGYIENFVQLHELEHVFKDTICFAETMRDKDVNIQLLMQRNGMSKAVYIGDTASDMLSCEKAKVPFIYAAYGLGHAVGATHIAKEPGDIINIIKDSAF